VGRSDVGSRAIHLLGNVVLLVYVGSRSTHFTGHCCWIMWGLGQHTLLGIDVGPWGLGQHTLLGIVYVGPNTLYWVLLLGYARLWKTNFTGHHC
jgi:hypothetical protein